VGRKGKIGTLILRRPYVSCEANTTWRVLFRMSYTKQSVDTVQTASSCFKLPNHVFHFSIMPSRSLDRRGMSFS
jgi:hypothetical protein